MNPQAFTRLTLATLALAAGTAAQANTVYADSDFNITSYRTTTAATQGLTIDITQMAAGGNPGTALQSRTVAPAGTGDFVSIAYITNWDWVYDTAVQGAIASITFSMDNAVSFSGVIGTNFLVYQGGNYYVYGQALPSASANIWRSAAPVTLQADDLALVTVLGNLTTDASQHPDFSSGNMLFGTFYALGGSATTHSVTIDRRFDNLSVSISAVPENGTLFMTLLGLLPVLGAKRLRQRRTLR